MSLLVWRAKPRGLVLAILATALAALVLFALSFLLPSLSSRGYYEKSLDLLRARALRIKGDFGKIVAGLDQRRQAAEDFPFPKEDREIWSRLRSLPLDKSTEGLGYFGPDGRLKAWLGNVVDLEPLFLDKAGGFPPPGGRDFVLREKASAYLLSVANTAGGGRLAVFRLLAYVPQFKSPYLEEYQFLSAKLRADCDIDYWDFREDVSGFDKLFSRHRDEYIGQPRLKEDVQSLIFPLRAGSGSILATVSLDAPTSQAYRSARREAWRLASELSLSLCLMLLLTFLVIRIFSSARLRPGLIAVFVLAVGGLRWMIFSLSRLEPIHSLRVFSPASASFFSLSFLTRSPADIFATSLAGLLILIMVTHIGRRLATARTLGLPVWLALAGGTVAGLVSLALSWFLERFLWILVNNSNLNLLRLSFSVSLVLLLLSVFSVIGGFFLLAWLLLRSAVVLRSGAGAVAAGWVVALVVFWAIIPGFGIVRLVLIFVPVLLVGLTALRPAILRQLPALVAGLALVALWLCASLNIDTLQRNRALLQHSLKNTVLSQELWAGFFLEEASAELDGQISAVLAFLKKPEDLDLAHALWEQTILAKFNWYSSLEILNGDSAVLSRFSLNVPKISQPAASPTPTLSWSLSRAVVSSVGQEKEFLVAVKDVFEGEDRRGRMVLSVSLDYEMLPFLYSANPYFELLRALSLPSLQPVDFRYAVFDTEGRIVFNPNKVTAGLQAELVSRVQASPEGVWVRWADKKLRFRGFFFMAGGRVNAFLLPVKTFLTYAVEFLKLFFVALALLGLPALLAAAVFPRRSLRRYFWSFSNRVYLALMAVAIIPLLLFTFSTRSFVNRIFSQQFADRAEIHADFARNVMEDYFFMQQEERRSPQAPPEDLVLWISSTIGNDVNLYQDGRLAFSSRAEFFDSGLLPELIDGETYYNLVVVRNPLVTQLRTIGDYSFHTLTIPYARPDSVFLISLPFPFEQSEISSATAELLEFLLFLFAFVLALAAVLARNMRAMIVSPIHQLLDATREAGRGNLDIRLEHKPNDEMKTLVEGFNAMIRNLKQHQADLAEMSQRAAWAEMARKVAHEIKNPLTPIQLSAEHLLRVYADRRGDFQQALKESTAYIIGEVENLRRIAQEFLESSREAPLRREPVDIRTLAEEMLTPYKKMLSDRIRLVESYESGPPLVCLGDKSKLKMAVRNIIINAIESIPGRGEIRLAVGRAEGQIRLEIRDTGQGMDQTVLDRIFEPSFSTKAAGAGLGLPIAKKIIEDHGGTIQVSSQPGRGTRVVILLPTPTT